MIKSEIIVALAGMAFSLIFLAILMSNRSKIRQAKIIKGESERYEDWPRSRGGSAEILRSRNAGEGSGRNEERLASSKRS